MPGVRSVPRAELIGGAVTLAVGAAWLWESRKYDYIAEGGRLAAGSLPALAGAVMAVCGLGIVVAAVVRSRSATENVPSQDGAHLLKDDEQTSDARSDEVLRSLVLLTSLVVCLLLAPIIGFGISFALLGFFIVRVLERRTLTAAVVTAASMWIAAFVFFETILQVPLP